MAERETTVDVNGQGGREGGSSPSRGRATRAAGVFLSVALWGVLGCPAPTETPVASSELTDIDADQVIYGMTTYLTQEGVRTGQLRADSAHVFNDSTMLHLFGVDMTVFTEQGGERAHVVADSGRLHQRTERMVAWGDVVATIAEGDRRIETSELNYDPGANRIWSDAETVFREGARVTQGSCFESDLQFQNRRVCSIRGSADIGTAPRPDTAGGGGR